MALQWTSTAYISRWHLSAKCFCNFVYTDFSEPYIATIEYPNGIAYMQFLKDILESDECRKCKGHIPKLHKFRVEQTKEVSNIKLFFPDNERLGETIEQIVN